MRHTTNDTNPTLVILRGVPCSGKSTLAKEIVSINPTFNIIDPDNVNTQNKEYADFSPRKTRNPSSNVKMYSYLYDKVESALKNGNNVIWAQPWSRIAEVDLTIKNLGYYLTDLKSNVWKTNLDNIIEKLPIKIYVVEIQISNEVSLNRWISKNNSDKSEIKRLIKTQQLFQPLSTNLPILILDGEQNLEINLKLTLDFLGN